MKNLELLSVLALLLLESTTAFGTWSSIFNSNWGDNDPPPPQARDLTSNFDREEWTDKLSKSMIREILEEEDSEDDITNEDDVSDGESDDDQENEADGFTIDSDVEFAIEEFDSEEFDSNAQEEILEATI